MCRDVSTHQIYASYFLLYLYKLFRGIYKIYTIYIMVCVINSLIYKVHKSVIFLNTGNKAENQSISDVLPASTNMLINESNINVRLDHLNGTKWEMRMECYSSHCPSPSHNISPQRPSLWTNSNIGLWYDLKKFYFIDLQYCVNFCYRAKWFIHAWIYIHTHISYICTHILFFM